MKAGPNPQVTDDIDGHIRPTNGSSDIGADEINSCLIRVIDPNTNIPTLFGVLQFAIDYAETFTATLPKVEIARGVCKGGEGTRWHVTSRLCH